MIRTDSVKENQLEALENIQKIWRCDECTDLFEDQDTALEHYKREHTDTELNKSQKIGGDNE